MMGRLKVSLDRKNGLPQAHHFNVITIGLPF